MGNFLDKSGVSTLWKRIKNNFDEVLVYKDGVTAYREVSDALAYDKLVVLEDGVVYPAIAGMELGGSAELWFWTGILDECFLFKKITIKEDNTSSLEDVDLQEHVKERLDVQYNSTTKRLYLAFDGTEFGSGIDASPFIKDGMLSDQSIITVTSNDTSLISAGYSVGEKLIKFTWNTDGGGKVDYLRVTDIAPTPYVEVSPINTTDSATVNEIYNKLSNAYSTKKRVLATIHGIVYEGYNLAKVTSTDGYSFLCNAVHSTLSGDTRTALSFSRIIVEVSHTACTVDYHSQSFAQGGDGMRYLGNDGGYHDLVYTLDLTGADTDISDGNITTAKRTALADAVQKGRRIWVKTGYGNGMAMLSSVTDDAVEGEDSMLSVYLTVMIQPTVGNIGYPKMYNVSVFYDNIYAVESINSPGSGAFLNDRMGFSVPASTFKIAKKSVADDGTITLNKTFAQIQAAIQQKKVILLEWDMGCIMTSAIDETSQCYMTFVSIAPTGDDAALVSSVQLTVTSAEQVTATVSQVDIEPQSALSESDIDAAIAAAENE